MYLQKKYLKKGIQKHFDFNLIDLGLKYYICEATWGSPRLFQVRHREG